MSWLDQLRPASFRGVPFQVDTLEHSAGDNVVLREYPFQDLPTVFRMGEAAEEIKFAAYVIGDDYMALRDRLRQALKADEPGELIHPTAGTMRVHCGGKYSIKESPTAEGGLARFDLTFIRADARRYPTASIHTSELARLAAFNAKLAAKDGFYSAWSLTNNPGWVADRAVARVRDAVAATWSKLARATQGLGDFTGAVIGNYQVLNTGLNDLVRTPRLLADQVATLFELPAELSQAGVRDFQAAFSWVFNLKQRLRQTDFEVIVMPAVGAGLVMYGTGKADALGTATPSRSQLAALTASSDQLIESLATAAWVEATARLDLGNYDEALALRQAVNGQVQRLLREASSAAAPAALAATSWHDAMLGLHTAALRDLQTRSRDLVRMTTYTPAGWESIWTISHKLFGTVAYADEIAAMNPHIRNPALVPPGRALRIVRHD